MNVEKQRKKGKFAAIALCIILISVYLFSNFSSYLSSGYLRDIISSINWLNLLFSLFLYALIPCIPAVILRVKLGIYVTKWIVLAAIVIAVLCLIIIIFSVETLFDNFDNNEWISAFSQFALTSSVPALYCVAFFERREVWSALLPCLMYFLSFFMRYAIIYGFAETMKLFRYFDLKFIYYQNPDPSVLIFVLTTTLMSAVFAVWALLCIFLSRIVYKFISHMKIKDNDKLKSKRNRFSV